ncbi:hypothetical protein PYCCODRAFT_1703 [Trametes coccinea BRFM310]|uniref:HSF-type DNA-binding domain-containing protein n=1 Tax=Trametes coccinea (strain BRFM310) TaxID=1353009 RepID=A0A1Y2J4B2_TRAC3|nr:hypothetical protein PYCCODRAFT_1703 [Trametes coccinea BRFM310]
MGERPGGWNGDGTETTPLSSPLLTVQTMDNSSHYPPPPIQRQLFPSSTLPPPSQLHLNSFPRNNTLPPISHLPTASRYPPPTYTHPSLSATASPLSAHSLSASSTLPWSHQRSSSSREDLPSARRLSESSSHRSDRDMARDSSHDHHHSSSNSVKHEPEDSMPSTSDFVKKLYKSVSFLPPSSSSVADSSRPPCRMLEDTSFADVVSWGPHGDCFVVKDMNEFTKSILPRMFKHSNFASFVRQLNKYDFHKVSSLPSQTRLKRNPNHRDRLRIRTITNTANT